MLKKKVLKKSAYALLTLIILANVVANFHAYKFTHFDPDITKKTRDGSELTFAQKLSALVFGISNPRPVNKIVPAGNYETVQLSGNKKIECWLMKAENAKGNIILFHGYSGKKSGMLDKADVFLKMGYNTLLVDFRGSGGSEGNITTVGYSEAEDVKAAYDYLKQKSTKPIILFGTSMGAAAVLKAQGDYQLKCQAIIIECPFGTLLQTVQSRFSEMGVPAFPMAHLLVFWGGIQNGFNGFKHNPEDYATKISCPSLLMVGGRDEKVSAGETLKIVSNLKGKKVLKIYPEARHENYLKKYKQEWTYDIQTYLNSL